jgi:redox-sensitive bicupin YhaK (pirin superfamily)
MSKPEDEPENAPMRRRQLLLAASGAGLALGAPAAASVLLGCRSRTPVESEAPTQTAAASAPNSNAASAAGADAAQSAAILELVKLGKPPWKTFDPFLFCVHHDDAYPRGNDVLGPAESLSGRAIGNDFEGRDGWRMYHGHVVPGFPRHPHRGFETVTVTRKGYIDHSDSMGATARYGNGDVQWMTAGSGIVHAEMFPLLDGAAPNPAELFQIWINLPAANKFVPPHFSMFWQQAVPRHRFVDSAGRSTDVVCVAGVWGELRRPAPPPNSWASRAGSDVAIWSLRMDPGARLTLPVASAGANRTLYFFRGGTLAVASRQLDSKVLVRLNPELAVELVNGSEESEVLLLQGQPIAEPVVSYGPFVMNDKEQIRQAFADYKQTGFGGWPWADDAPVHARTEGRFAVHADGRREKA